MFSFKRLILYHGDPSKIITRFHLVFSTSLSFRYPFVTGVSSCRLYMLVHQGFNFLLEVFNKFLFRGSQVFFILHSKMQLFLPYHLRWCYVIVDNFPSCFVSHKLSRIRYCKSINLFVGVILCHVSPKAFPKDRCYLWCL